MQCDPSNYDLFVEVPAKFKGVVDLKDHSGDDASEVLALLLAEGCSAVVRPAKRARNGRAAIWEGDGFAFRNFLLNTSEVAERVEVKPSEIVNCVKAGVLSAYPTPNGFFWFVVKDAKLDALTHMRVIAAKIPMKRSVKCKGLSRLVSALSSKSQGFPVNDFGVDEVKAALEREVDWKVGREYGDKSLQQTMTKLENDGEVIRVVDSPRDIGTRRWSFVKKPAVAKAKAPGHSVPSVAASVSPSPATVSTKKDQMVEELAGELAGQVRQRARELLGL